MQLEVFFTLGGDGQIAANFARIIDLYLLEIPVFVKGRLPAGPGAIGFFAGPDFLVILSKDIYTTIGDYQRTNRPGFLPNAMNAFQFGVVFGFDYAIPLGPGELIFDIRSLQCLTDIHPAGHMVHNDIKQNSVTLMVGYGFALTKRAR